MFEIGNSLREARLRQGIELSHIEADTKVRSKYLQALEEERFDLLPGETYAKGFLRSYADYLGLDGQLYVDEFNSRFSRDEEPVVMRPPARRRARSVESNLVVVALAGIVAVTILVVVGLAGIGSSDDRQPPLAIGGGPGTTAATTNAAPAPKVRPPKKGRKAGPVRVRLVAARGDCWLQVWAGSPSDDNLLYAGTLEAGQAQRFARKRLWIRLGAPTNVEMTLNGKRVRNLPSATADVIVTAKGVRTVASG